MADPNSVVIHDRKLVVMMICKAANTSIKCGLAVALGLPPLDLPPYLEPHRRLDLHLPTPNRMDAWAMRREGYTVVGVVRHPLARLVSCWRDKVEGALWRPFRRDYGPKLRAGMPFEEFVEFVAETPDGMANQHFRSMRADLVTHDAAAPPELIPEFLFRVEDPTWWIRLSDLLAERCDLALGPERRENATGGGDWRDLYDARTEAMARHRYSKDFEVFGYGA